MASKGVTVDLRGDVCIVRMKNPPTNALTPASIDEIMESVMSQAGNKDVFSIIIASDLDDFFIAGADVKAMLKMTQDEAMAFSTRFNNAMLRLEDQEKVLIAAINGHALGGGLELALACDFRFMAAGSGSIGLPEVTLGLIPGGGGTQRLSRLVGLPRAKEMVLNGSRIEPDTALSIGLVDRLFPRENFLEEVVSHSRKLLRGASMAKLIANRAIRKGYTMDYAGSFRYETRCFGEVFSTSDAREGMASFIDKRKPEFKGR